MTYRFKIENSLVNYIFCYECKKSQYNICSGHCSDHGLVEMLIDAYAHLAYGNHMSLVTLWDKMQLFYSGCKLWIMFTTKRCECCTWYINVSGPTGYWDHGLANSTTRHECHWTFIRSNASLVVNGDVLVPRQGACDTFVSSIYLWWSHFFFIRYIGSGICSFMAHQRLSRPPFPFTILASIASHK